MLKEALKTLSGESIDWKRLLNLEHEPTFGLDIGSSSVRLLQLAKDPTGSTPSTSLRTGSLTTGGRYSVTAAALADIPANGLDLAETQMNTSNAIRTCLELTGIESRSAVCGVSGPEVAVRDFKFPALAPEEIEGAVALDAGQACPFSISESVVDYHLLSVGLDCVSGVLVAATQKVVKNKALLAHNAEVKTVLMDVDGLAMLNCFMETQGRMQGQTVTILNIGNSCATLAILGDGNNPSVRDILHAGEHIIAEIANAKSLSREQVRQILYAEGLNSPQLDAEIVKKACQNLVSDVTDTLRFYTAQQKSAFIDKIYVCGGFALVKGFAEFLGTQLAAKVILWNPFDKIGCPVVQYKDVVTKYGPAFAVAAGLAMRSI